VQPPPRPKRSCEKDLNNLKDMRSNCLTDCTLCDPLCIRPSFIEHEDEEDDDDEEEEAENAFSPSPCMLTMI
jgi:hypothetical protein